MTEKTRLAIASDTVVTLEVTMRDLQGNLLEKGTVAYLHGHADIFPVVELALQGKKAGDEVRLKLEPHEAFGDFDETAIRIADESDFEQGVTVGLYFEELRGERLDRPYRVTDIAGGKVVLDGNHPLAGCGLALDIKVLSVEPATGEETSELAGFLSVTDRPAFNLDESD